MESLLTNDILDLMRRIGDPLVESAFRNAYPSEQAATQEREARINDARQKHDGGQQQGFKFFLEGDWLQTNAAKYGIGPFLKSDALPDPHLVKTACDLFARYGSEIAAALLLAALPEGYAAGEGAKVLAQRSQLLKGSLSTARILATAQFVIWVLTPGPLAPPVSGDMDKYTYQSFDATCRLWGNKGQQEGQALRASLALRIMHYLIRETTPIGIQTPASDDTTGAPVDTTGAPVDTTGAPVDTTGAPVDTTGAPVDTTGAPVDTKTASDDTKTASDDTTSAFDDPESRPLNQEDLLATLLTFSITVFEVLEQFGISWTAEEQEAYFYVWDYVGEILGIGDESVILELTKTKTFTELKKKVREFDEGIQPKKPKKEVGASDTAEAVDNGGDDAASGEDFETARKARSHFTPQEVNELFEQKRNRLFEDPRNRRVLRRVADTGTLRPKSVPEARALLARLRERMWTLEYDRPPLEEPFSYENFKLILHDVSPGRMLLKAMVDEVAARLPASQKTWPIAVIRQLVPPQVQNRLALGGTSSIGFFTGILDTPRDFPGSVAVRRIAAEILRQRATRVADSLFLYYYDKGQLTIPGLLSTTLGYDVPQ